MINVQPFFILANPRSGSSLLRIICESHPSITVPPESCFMEWWYEKYKDWSINDSQSRLRVDDYCKDLISSKKFETWNFNIDFYKDVIREHQPENYSELIALVYISFGIQNKKSLLAWGDKNNYYLNKTSLINKLYPNAKYIHLVRDGRDVAVSYLGLKNLKSESKYAPKLPNTITEIANEWNKNNKILLSFFNSISENRILRIRYEDLIQNIKKECLRITSFLTVPFDDNMLDYYKINNLKTLEPKEMLDWKKKTLEKPDKKNIKKYKNELSNSEIDLFSSIAKESLKAFDYED